MSKFAYRHYMVALLLIALTGCGGADPKHENSDQIDHGAATEDAVIKGPHGGRLLVDGEFALELAIFETGSPPEFRVWVTDAGVPVAPGDVDLHVTLTRLGGVKDEIEFAAQDDFLRGDTIIYEPHSFIVTIKARMGSVSHRWEYENFEGRTRIEPEIARTFGLETELSGPAKIQETVAVYGRIVPDPERVSSVSARFEGVIESVAVSVGDSVRPGQILARIESNESLRSYTITAPIEGILTKRQANPGEQTDRRQLFEIMDTSTVWAELAVFPSDRAGIRIGAPVVVEAAAGNLRLEGRLAHLKTVAEANQSVLARVVLENPDGVLVPGLYVAGEIRVAEHSVPLAVRRSGLQSFRDFTVVYALIGDVYEVRMLDLGRRDTEWVEVLGGLEPGTRYVTTNSYLVKADIEKSGASHDH